MRTREAGVKHGELSPPHCRNCGAEATWNYCPQCGQETRLALPPAFAFLRDAAGRYIRLDGRLLRSLHALLFKPGFLTREYLAGRRRRYVQPARLFVALSIVLFAVLRFSAGTPAIIDATSNDPARDTAIVEGGGGTSRLGFASIPISTSISTPAAPVRGASSVRRAYACVPLRRRDHARARAFRLASRSAARVGDDLRGRIAQVIFATASSRQGPPE